MPTQPVWLQNMGFYAQMTLSPLSQEPLPPAPGHRHSRLQVGEERVLTCPRWWSWAAGKEGVVGEGLAWRRSRWIGWVESPQRDGG